MMDLVYPELDTPEQNFNVLEFVKVDKLMKYRSGKARTSAK